jgi:hypothetical protein
MSSRPTGVPSNSARNVRGGTGGRVRLTEDGPLRPAGAFTKGTSASYLGRRVHVDTSGPKVYTPKRPTSFEVKREGNAWGSQLLKSQHGRTGEVCPGCNRVRTPAGACPDLETCAGALALIAHSA